MTDLQRRTLQGLILPHTLPQVRERLRMALERVAVLEEELELSNQEVGGWAEKGWAMSWRRTKKRIGCILKEESQWAWTTEIHRQ